MSAFLGWLRKVGEITITPAIPWPTVREHAPRLLSAEAQRNVLAAIPEPSRGIFLALALLGLRPSEAARLRAADYAAGDPGWLTIRATKNRQVERLPVLDELADWTAPPGRERARAPSPARPPRRTLGAALREARGRGSRRRDPAAMWIQCGSSAKTAEKVPAKSGSHGGGAGNRTRVRMASGQRVYVRSFRSVSARQVTEAGEPRPAPRGSRSPLRSGGARGASLLMTLATR